MLPYIPTAPTCAMDLSTEASSDLARQRRRIMVMEAFTCKTCAMSCRYFTRIECERHDHQYWEPADRSRCASCPSWHPVKQCCYRQQEPCKVLADKIRDCVARVEDRTWP
ncbi:MAG: hypothetical protein GYA24_14640 [Candidatus Lokiarchaeota archaeon]|nr:hypothetical protein [Candidatus Lokiarchaeota archaeon]